MRRNLYDNAGQLLAALGKESGGTTNRLHEQLSCVYDAAGNLTWRTNNGLRQQFQVNPLNELTTSSRSGTLTVVGTTTSPATNVAVNGLLAELYGDATFAKEGFSLADGTNIFTATAQDAYGRSDTNTSVAYLPSSVCFAYDLNGNLRTNGTRIFDYDDENQLIRLTEPDAWKSEFDHDGKGRRRIRREYNWVPGLNAWQLMNEIHYVYDNNLVIQERWYPPQLPSVAPSAISYTRGSDLSGKLDQAGGIGGLLARSRSVGFSGTAYYHCDGAGSVAALLDASQVRVAIYSYDPFGHIVTESGPAAGNNPYRFSSREEHTPSGLLHFLRRAHSPESQRWVSRDRLGEVAPGEPSATEGQDVGLPFESVSGCNLFRYVRNDPINMVDPLGNDFWKIQKCGIGHQFIIGQNPDGTYWDSDFSPDTPSGYGVSCKGKTSFNEKSPFDPTKLGDPCLRVVSHIVTSPSADARLKAEAKRRHTSKQARYDLYGYNCRSYCDSMEGFVVGAQIRENRGGM